MTNQQLILRSTVQTLHGDEIKGFFHINNLVTVTLVILWETQKAVLRGKIITYSPEEQEAMDKTWNLLRSLNSAMRNDSTGRSA